MGIINSIYINKPIVQISLDTSDISLVQGVKYDSGTNSIVHNISRKILFELNTGGVEKLSDNIIHIDLPEQDIAVVYKINENDTITRVNHLHIKFDDNTSVILFNEPKENYYQILKNIPKNLMTGVFAKLSSNKIVSLVDMDWDKEFNLESLKDSLFFSPSTKPYNSYM